MQKLVKNPLGPPELQSCERPGLSATKATVKIVHVGLCRTDLLVAHGALPLERSLVLGHECSGHVLHDPSGLFAPGTPVAVNPLLDGNRFLGLHTDGALQSYILIEPKQLVAAGAVPLKLAAYVEPVAASMAVLKARITPDQKGVIYHANRISHLSYLVLASLGYDITWHKHAPTGAEQDEYDYAIETLFEAEPIEKMLQALKPGGLLVVKSRQYAPRAITPGLLVAKELTLQAVNYADFTSAMRWLDMHQELVEPLIGESYALADWQAAFTAATPADARKIFIHLEA